MKLNTSRQAFTYTHLGEMSIKVAHITCTFVPEFGLFFLLMNKTYGVILQISLNFKVI